MKIFRKYLAIYNTDQCCQDRCEFMLDDLDTLWDKLTQDEKKLVKDYSDKHGIKKMYKVCG